MAWRPSMSVFVKLSPSSISSYRPSPFPFVLVTRASSFEEMIIPI